MKDADTTWALVVGIDVYDNVKGLKGPVRDAIAVVGWLRQLGVADDQILLHASPCPESQEPLRDLGIAHQGCTEPEIWQSLSKLLNNTGSRLFIFLLGHGYYLFDGGPVFLTQEADRKSPTNIGITWLTDLLRATNYQRQFFLMDGCLNYAYSGGERPTIDPGKHNGPTIGAAQAGVRQWFAYAASQGQTAAEPNGRGLFTTTLLAALDLTTPNPLCTTIDDATGTYELDLNKAITDVVYVAVTQQIPTQEPGIRRLDSGPADAHAIVATITPAQTVALQTLVDPAAAVPEVDSVTLVSRTFVWERKIPDAKGSALNLPHTCVLPAGMRLTGWCEMKPNTDWEDPEVETLTTGSGVDLVFKVERAISIYVVKLTTVGDDAIPVPMFNDALLSALDDFVTPAGAHGEPRLALSPTGDPVYEIAGDEEHRESFRQRIAEAINRHTPSDVHVALERQQRPVESAPQWHGWTLGIDLDAKQADALGGFLADWPFVHIGESGRTISLLELAADDQLKIDGLAPARVELNLPWGRWVTIVEPPATPTGITPRLVFPSHVGLPPVRNGLRYTIFEPDSFTERAIRNGVAAFDLAVVNNEHAISTLRAAVDDRASRLFRGDDRTDDWIAIDGPKRATRGDLTLYRSEKDLPQAGWPIGRLDRGSSTPLFFPMSHPNLAFDDQITPRIEPLSATTSPLWDLLVGAGKLDGLDRHHVPLIAQTGETPLVLAAMYGCYVNGFGVELFTLSELIPEDTDQPDVVILRHAYAMRFVDATSTPAPRATVNVGELDGLATDSRVPVFKWGLAIGQAVAQHFDVPALAAKFKYIEDRLMTGSNWTLWHGDDGPARPMCATAEPKTAARAMLTRRADR